MGSPCRLSEEPLRTIQIQHQRRDADQGSVELDLLGGLCNRITYGLGTHGLFVARADATARHCKQGSRSLENVWGSDITRKAMRRQSLSLRPKSSHVLFDCLCASCANLSL